LEELAQVRNQIGIRKPLVVEIVRVTVWNEYRHERNDEETAKIYPDGIHGALAAALRDDSLEVHIATLDEPEHGLTEVVERVHERVLGGMGLIVLHSGHFSKIFKRLTDLRGNAFYDMYLWPANFLDADSPAQWTELRMDAGEIQALSSMAADSTQQLATTLTTDPAQAQTLDVDVSNLSLELDRVEVMRPWLEPLVFENRAWRWPDDREPLSDGEEPPNGSLPAYVSAIVFARNLEIELEESSEQIVGQFHAVP
jgi:hypothetical protein